MQLIRRVQPRCAIEEHPHALDGVIEAEDLAIGDSGVGEQTVSEHAVPAGHVENALAGQLAPGPREKSRRHVCGGRHFLCGKQLLPAKVSVEVLAFRGFDDIQVEDAPYAPEAAIARRTEQRIAA
jgi:hypothetical protein